MKAVQKWRTAASLSDEVGATGGGEFNGGTVRRTRRRKRRAAGCVCARGAEVAAAGRR